MNLVQYFNYATVASEAAVPPKSLDALSRQIRRDFPADDMMFELHMLRACLAIRDGYAALAEALGEPAAQSG
ncbi:MAG: hypothetical protein HUU22_18650 [Phycisphaerae bacterium]|nr:hypothetical protein [Phycisphaerae bacterium]NUQ48037.1 hypothetical protein [Phycisphaerae bacterium]